MTTPTNKLGWAQRWLRQFTDADTAEAIIGDIAEALSGETARKGTVPTSRLVVETLSATWLLVLDRWASRRPLAEGGSTMDSWSPSHRRIAAWVGLTACIPALLLVTGGMLQILFGTPQVLRVLDQTIHNPDVAAMRLLRHPAMVLGGLLLAGALNLLPLLRVGVSRQAGEMIGTLTLRTRTSHLAVGALAGLLLTVLLAYGFTENFTIEPRPPAVAAVPQMVFAPCPGQGGWTTGVRLESPDGEGGWSTAWPRPVTLQPGCAESPP